MAPTRKLGELFYELGVRTEGLKKDLDQSERAFGKFTSFVLKNPVIALAAVGSAALGVAAKATQMAAQIDASMRKVAASVPTGAAGLETLRKELERISIATGKTQEELAQASEEIARLGAGSAVEVAARLRAATEASQATGTDLQSVIAGLDQTLDLFGLSSTDAARALAELFTVTRGRASLEDVFQTLEKAAPSIQKLGLDLPTASRALIQLTESGLSTEKAAIALKKLADSGESGRKEVERLAAVIPKAADPMADLAKAAQNVNDSATNAGPRIRAELNATLEKLGNRILPGLNAEFQALLRVIDRFQGGTPEQLQQSFTSIIALGRSVLPVLATNDWNEASEKIRTVQRAILQLSDASLSGRVDLEQFGVKGLGLLANQIAKFSTQTRLFTPEQRKELQAFLEQIIKAQAELVRLQNTNIGKAAPPTGDTETDEARAARLAREQSEREAATRALRDMEQGFTDLFARAEGGNVSLDDFDRSVRELGDAFRDKLKKATAEQASLFATLEARATGVRDVLATITAKKAALEFDALRASLTPSLVDDFRVSLRQLGEELERRKLSPEQIEDLKSLKQAQLDVLVGSEDLDARMQSIIARSISTFDAQLGLMDALRRAEEELRLARTAPDALTDAGEIRIQGLLKQIEILQAKIKELGGSSGAALDVGNANRFVDALSDASDFALGLSTALLGADDTITRMIAGVAQEASGFGKVAELAGKAGGLSQLFSSGAGIASALPAIGGVIGGLGAIFSAFGQDKTDPLREKQIQVLEENNARLKELRDGLVDALAVRAGGGKVSAILNTDLSASSVINGVPTVTGPRDITDVLKELERAGVGLADLKQIAKDLNVEFAKDIPSIAELSQLQAKIYENLQAVYRRFNESLAGQLEFLALRARIDPDAFKGISGVLERLKVLAGPKGSPLIEEILKLVQGGDLAGAAAAAKQLFDQFAAGQIDIAQLGGIDPKDFLEIITSIIEGIREATPSAQTAAQRFADALEAFGVAVELGSLDASTKLEKALALFGDLFPDLAGSVDTSSAEAFRASIKGIIDGFAADGELTDAENAQIAVLRALLDAFEGATPAAETLVEALAVLEDRFAIFGTSAADQIEALLQQVTGDESLGKNAAFSLLDGLTAGLDLATKEGQGALRDRAQRIFALLAEGGITEQEQSVIEILKRILGLAADVSNEAVKAAADAAAEAARLADEARSRREKILADAETEIAIFDITDPVDQLRVRVKALAAAFPELADVLAQFDTATQEGRDALEHWIQQMFETPGALDDVAAAVGLSVEDLVAKLLGLEDGADAAAQTVQTLAEQLQSAFDEIDFDVALNNITDPLAKLQQYARGIAATIPEISQALAGIDLSTATGRRQAEAALVALGKQTTDPTIRSAILNILEKIRTLQEDTAGLGAGADPLAAKNSILNVQSAATVTEVTANRWLDVMTTDLALSRERNALLAQIFASVASAPIIRPPALAGAAAAGPGTVINVEIPVYFNAPVTTADATELAALLQQSIYRVITQELAVQLQVSQRLAGKAAA